MAYDTTTKQSKPCSALTRLGQPCRAPAVDGTGLCFWHSEDRADDRLAAASSGGKARHGRRGVTDQDQDRLELVKDVGDVAALLARTLADCMKLENSLARARTVGYVCGVLVRALEVSDLEDRIAALEEKIR